MYPKYLIRLFFRVAARLDDWNNWAQGRTTVHDTPPIRPTTALKVESWIDNYLVLGLTPGANLAEVRRQKRALSLSLHPDKVPRPQWGPQRARCKEEYLTCQRAWSELLLDTNAAETGDEEKELQIQQWLASTTTMQQARLGKSRAVLSAVITECSSQAKVTYVTGKTIAFALGLPMVLVLVLAGWRYRKLLKTRKRSPSVVPQLPSQLLHRDYLQSFGIEFRVLDLSQVKRRWSVPAFVPLEYHEGNGGRRSSNSSARIISRTWRKVAW